MDAAIDRQSDNFNRAVEVTRMGSIFARNQKAYQQWSQKAHRAPGTHRRGLTGAALEAAVNRIAQQFPDNVIRGVAA